MRPPRPSPVMWRTLAICLTILSVPGTALAVEATGGLPNQLVHLY